MLKYLLFRKRITLNGSCCGNALCQIDAVEILVYIRSERYSCQMFTFRVTLTQDYPKIGLGPLHIEAKAYPRLGVQICPLSCHGQHTDIMARMLYMVDIVSSRMSTILS